MTCERVVIINKGRVVAEDTPDNLTRRLKGAGTMRVEVRGDEARSSTPLRAVPGVARRARARRPRRHGRRRRRGRGRAATCAPSSPGPSSPKGCGLLGLQQVGMSLEEIFLHLTTDGRRGRGARRPDAEEVTRVTALRNIAAIVEKEWRHYFGSPIA